MEGFKDTIMLEEDSEHRIDLKVFETMENQQYKWSCTPVLDQLVSDTEAVCPFETSPVSLNPHKKISSKDFNPAGAKFELTLSMLRDNSNIVEKCSVFVQKKFNENAQKDVIFAMKGLQEVVDPTRENIFTCAPESADLKTDGMAFTWTVIDVFKGSQMMLKDMKQEGNKVTIGMNQLRYNREYMIKCNGNNAEVRGEASMRVMTVEKASDIKFTVLPDLIGVSETTVFSMTVEKMANEDLACKFFQELNGADIRLDDENRVLTYSKEKEKLEATVKKDKAFVGSQTIKVTAFCASKDLQAQYIKSVDLFIKPKPATAAEQGEAVIVDDDQDLKSVVDPVGLLIFGKDMNDEQRVNLFQDMTEKLFVKSQMETNSLELATITKKILELIPSAQFQKDEAEQRIYLQMANVVKRQLNEMGFVNGVVDAVSLKKESLSVLTECVDLLIKQLPRSQTSLINALKVGLLRDVGQVAGKQQTFTTPSFSAV